jgi:hypothetical protein
MARGCVSHSLDDSAMSVRRNVTTPAGNAGGSRETRLRSSASITRDTAGAKMTSPAAIRRTASVISAASAVFRR